VALVIAAPSYQASGLSPPSLPWTPAFAGAGYAPQQITRRAIFHRQAAAVRREVAVGLRELSILSPEFSAVPGILCSPGKCVVGRGVRLGNGR
jgi:hypothetical protein